MISSQPGSISASRSFEQSKPASCPTWEHSTRLLRPTKPHSPIDRIEKPRPACLLTSTSPPRHSMEEFKMTNLRFQTMKTLPEASAPSSGMHPDTQSIINQLNAAKGPVVSCTGFPNPTAAKRRLDALRRARARGLVKFKQGQRKASALFFQLK